jgi:hypothetical protein
MLRDPSCDCKVRSCKLRSNESICLSLFEPKRKPIGERFLGSVTGVTNLGFSDRDLTQSQPSMSAAR